jgi:coatomer subunit beta
MTPNSPHVSPSPPPHLQVAVNTNITDVHHFLRHIQAATNMNCLTPAEELQKQENFLAANLYARSVFGEDALVNLSVEKQADGKVGGYIRIRSKTQGIALSLGDRITAKQKIEQDRVLEE